MNLHRNMSSKLRISEEQKVLQDNNDTKYEDTMCELEFNPDDVESHKDIKYTNEDKTKVLRKYACCAEVWKGLFLMFFYQFAGYNVVSFYATSILDHPKETEKELIHPNKTNNFMSNFDEMSHREK